MRASSDCRWSRAARLLFTLVMTLVWCGAVPAARAQPAAPVPGDDGGGAIDAQKFVKVLGRLTEVAEQELRRGGLDVSDVPAKAAELGFDPDRAYAFVRDAVAFEPYAGHLRGGHGALASMGGNALDKSLLLHDLLAASGVESRVVKGALPADRAAALVRQFLARPGLPVALTDYAAADAAATIFDPQTLAALSAEVGIRQAELERFVAAQQSDARAAEADAWALADREEAPLRQRLRQENVALGRPFEQWVTELAERCADHAWVERKLPDGTWQALDVSFADAKPGEARGDAGQPIAAPAPADQHRLDFKLVYRRATAAGTPPEEINLLEVAIPSAEAMVDYPAFMIYPADPVPSFSELSAMPAADAVKAFAAVKRYQPVLQVGGKRYAGKPFDLDGEVYEVSPSGAMEGASKIGGSVGGLFGGGGLAGGGEAKPASTFVDLGVTLTLQRPGGKPLPQTRTLLRAEQTRGDHVVSPMMRWELLVQPQPISGTAAAFGATQHMVETFKPMLAAAAAGGGDVAPADLDRLARQSPKPYPQALVGLSMMRQSAMAKQLAENPGVALLWDVPQVTILEHWYCMRPASGHACGHVRVDIVENAVSFVPRDAAGDAAGQAATCALRQGLFDTAAELKVVAAAAGSAGHSPLDDFEQARQAQVPLVAFAAGHQPAAAVALAESDRAWIAGNEPAGRLILTPGAAPAVGGAPGWWTLDPQTGTILGRRDGGRGDAMNEYQITTNLIGFAACMVSPMWDVATGQVKGTKGGLKLALGLTACMVGTGVGFSPALTKVPLRADKIAMVWAICTFFVAVTDKALG